MISLKHPVTGHEIKTDEASQEFWVAAGYRAPSEEKPKPARKRASKKSDS